MVGFCFRIPKVHSHCCSCKKPFTESQPLLSYLKDGENKQKLRCDFCLSCLPAKDFESLFWQRLYPQKSQDKDPWFKRLIDLFLDLLAKEDEKSKQLAYTLFQLLKRQKKAFLISKEIVSKTCETWLLEVDGHMVSLVDIPKEEQVSAWLSSEVFEEIKLLLGRG